MSKLVDFRRCLEILCKQIAEFTEKMDEEMKKPSTPERGSRIARLLNQLEMDKDRMRFGPLGIDFRTGKKRKLPKAKNETTREKVKQVLHDRGFKGY